MTGSGGDKQSQADKSLPQLYRCEPEYWLWMPKPVRIALGWVFASLFSLSFLSIPMALVLLIPAVWRNAPIGASLFLALLVLSVLAPAKESVFFRKACQLMYEVFDFSTNLSPSDIERLCKIGEKTQFIYGMHPHGIVPLHSGMYAAFNDQYMLSIYGFGAVADVTLYIPFLRNIVVSISSFVVFPDSSDRKCGIGLVILRIC